MLVRFDPFRELDRLTQQAWSGIAGREPVMPMDAYRRGDEFVVQFDLPGVAPDSVDVTVERNVLTVSAERVHVPNDGEQVVARERLHGRFSRQLVLGEALDADRIDAQYRDGVLTLTIPVAEQAKPKRVEIRNGNGDQQRELTAVAS